MWGGIVMMLNPFVLPKSFLSPTPNKYVAGTVLELDGSMPGSLFQTSKLVMGNSFCIKKHTSADLIFYFTIRFFLAP
jgi:hypothetical protein